MYKNLKFSWAHILAFLAIICMGYVTYVGLTYKMNDGFFIPFCGTMGILVIILIWFIGAQQLKGINNKFSFKRCVILERFFVFTSPVVFIFCLIPFNHAWNVYSHADEIEEIFRKAIESSTQMFDDYEVYAKERISNYHDFLERVKANKDIQPTIYEKIGFSGKNDDKKIKIETEMLTRQLMTRYDSLNIEARKWIERANQSTSVWNIFLVGNIHEIKSAFICWSQQLVSFSSMILSTEVSDDGSRPVSFNASSFCKEKLYSEKVEPFHIGEEQHKAVIEGLDNLSDFYTANDHCMLISFVLGFILYFMFLLPYLIQKRNGVSTYQLFGRRFMNEGLEVPSSLSHDEPITTIDMEKSASHSKERNQVIDSSDNMISGGILDDEDDIEKRRKKRRERRECRNARIKQEHKCIRNHSDGEEDDLFINPIEDIK